MSDHNTIITKLDIKWEMRNNAIKNEIFNLKNIIGQKKFKEMTSKTGVLSDIFKDETKDLESMTNKFMKKLNRILHQCFTKTRVKDTENREITKLFDKRRSLRRRTDNNSKQELIKVEEELAKKCSKENYLKIKEELKCIESEEGGIYSGKLWKLKKKLSPRGRDPPTAQLSIEACPNT